MKKESTAARAASSNRMSAVKSINNSVEKAFRRQLWQRGIRYQTYVKTLPGKPDIVVGKHRLAIFVDGDFWHGGQWVKRRCLSLEEQFLSSENPTYWIKKIRRNMSRDAMVTSLLLTQGWRVLRFWESEILKDMEACVNKVIESIRMPRRGFPDSLIADKTVAEFFAGIGLMRLGLEKDHWRVMFANDIDQAKKEMYDEQFQDQTAHFSLQDVHELSVDEVPSVTLATASFPCNDLSLAGGRAGLAGKNSSAFWGFARILEEMQDRRPPLVLLENVVGFLTSNGGADFKQVLQTLNNLGYSVDCVILDAGWFVPQSRQRLFVIGVRDNDKALWQLRERQQGFFESAVRPKVLADFIFTNPDIRWSVRDLPEPPRKTSRIEDVLENLHDDAKEWWNVTRAEYLLNQMSDKHRKIADQMIMGNEYSYATVFRRVRKGRSMAELRTDGIAGCLRTPRGGSGRQILFKAGQGNFWVRLITPRECARLMGAPDYKIEVGANQALFGFGDAVCVPVIEWLAIHYLDPLVMELMRGRLLNVTEKA